MSQIYNFQCSNTNIFKKPKKVKLILTTYLLSNNPKYYHFNSNIKIDILHSFFFIRSLQNMVYILSSDQPHFKWLIATDGLWLPYWTEQVYEVIMLLFLINYLFYFREGERELTRVEERGRGRERENPKQTLPPEWSLTWGAIPQSWDRDPS